ncbi:hypothetical protein FHX45_001766 [Amycolatopsis granulosa]|nr:hypothetical protein [Amycolatopsis granulosa]
MLVDGEPAQGEPVRDGLQQVRRPRRHLVAALPGHRTAQDDPAVRVHHLERGLEVRTAHVVEIHVDTARRGGAELLDEPTVVVVERRVEPEFVDEVPHLRRAARASDDAPGAEQPGHLTGEAAHRARRAGDEHRVAGPHPADLGEPDVAGEPAREVGGERGQGIRIDPGEPAGPGQRVLAPAQHVGDRVPGSEIR